MAITKSAKKAHRQSLRKRIFNMRRTRAMKDAATSFRKLIAGGKGSEAAAAIPGLYQAIDKAAKRGIINKNAADRMKSRLTKKLAVK